MDDTPPSRPGFPPTAHQPATVTIGDTTVTPDTITGVTYLRDDDEWSAAVHLDDGTTLHVGVGPDRDELVLEVQQLLNG